MDRLRGRRAVQLMVARGISPLTQRAPVLARKNIQVSARVAASIVFAASCAALNPRRPDGYSRHCCPVSARGIQHGTRRHASVAKEVGELPGSRT